MKLMQTVGASGVFAPVKMSEAENCRARNEPNRSNGFSLIELMVVVVIIAILAAIAWPIYGKYVSRTRRVAAEGCLSEYANYMERYYTTHLRYDNDGGTIPVANTLALASLDCPANAQTGRFYDYAFPAGGLSVSSYKIEATPKEPQATSDAICGTLSINQAGARTPTTAGCW